MMTIRRPSAARVPMALALALILAGSGPVEARGKTTLRWKFKAGEVLRYSMDQTTVSTGQDPEGREVTQTIGLIMDMTWTVKSVDASGVASLSQTIDRLRTTATAPFGKFSFDSKDAGSASGAAGPLFKMLVGAEFAVKVDPRGEIAEVKLSEALLNTLRGENETPGAAGQFSEAGLKNMIAQMVVPLPEASVDVGEAWRKGMAVPSGPEGQTRPVEQTYTYKGPSTAPGSPEVFTFTTKFEPIKASPNVPVTFKKEVATGQIEFDNGAGRIVKSTVTEDVEVSVAFEGKDLAQKVETTRVLTLSKDKAP